MKPLRSKELRFLFLIFFSLVTLSSSLLFINLGLERNFNFTASEVFGADASVESSYPLSKEYVQLADNYRLKHAEVVSFMSMIFSGDKAQLANIRVLNDDFPLRGHIKIMNQKGELFVSVPKPNTVWADSALQNRLNIKIGDKLKIGQAEFTLSGTLVQEPARAGNFVTFAPKIILSANDINKTGLLRPESRALYQLFLAGDDYSLKAYIDTLRKKSDPISIYTVKEGRPFANTIFDRAQRYLGLFIILTVILGGLGIGLLANYFTQSQNTSVALLRTLGASKQQIINIYIKNTLQLGLGLMLISIGLGALLIVLLARIFPHYLNFGWEIFTELLFWKMVLLNVLSGVVILAGFALFPIFGLIKIPPLYLFRKESVSSSSNWGLYFISGLSILVLLKFYIQPFADALLIFSYILLCSSIIFILFYAFTHWVTNRFFTVYFIAFRGREGETSLLLSSLSVVFLTAGLLLAIYYDFFQSWLKVIPEKAPNQFAINISEKDKLTVKQYWLNQGIEVNLYPMITARLLKVNNEDKNYFRPLNISYTNILPQNNQILTGEAWGNDQTGKGVISIEKGFADRLGVTLGDTMSFEVSGQTITAKIVNIRSVQWESFQPNFFVIFPERVLNDFPKTYITSFYLSLEKSRLMTPFLQKFPEISVIDVNFTLTQARDILNKVVNALKILITCLGLIAILVLFANTWVSYAKRLYESALLRSFGASKNKLLLKLFVEFGSLGALSAGVGMGGGLMLADLLSVKLEVPYSPHWVWILPSVLVGALCVGLLGWLGCRHALQASPMELLKEQQ